MGQRASSLAMFLLRGKGVSQGVVIGRAIIMEDSDLEIPHYYIDSAEIESECERLMQAIRTVQADLAELQRELPADAPKELAPLLSVHSMLVGDPMLAAECQVLIREHSYNAEWALSNQGQHLAEQFQTMEDSYLRERALDVRQVIELVIDALQGGGKRAIPLADKLSSSISTIVVARDISPADMIRMREADFAGFITDIGGSTSHTAIVARSMGVPAVVAAVNARLLIHDHDIVVIDGESGDIIVNPTAEILAHYQEKALQLKANQSIVWEQRYLAAESTDQVEVTVLGNIENPEEAADVLTAGGQGIGLYRTEFLFMGDRDALPSEDEQYEAYAYVLKQMQGQPVTIRTLDVGADKTISGENSSAINPALGLRAVRYCLARPEMFMLQLKALLRAAVHGPLKILVPMVAHRHEILTVKRMLSQAARELEQEGKAFSEDYELGIMIEIPAIALIIDLALDDVDFVSIGTNDLIQYMLAIDRIDSEVSDLYDPLHLAVIRIIAHVIDTCNQQNKPVSVCGEMAGEPRFTRLLLGLGLRNFSMSSKQIPQIKQIIRQSHIALTTDKVRRVMLSNKPIELDAAGYIIEAIN